MVWDIRELLEARSWRAFDVDAAGRVLAGWDDSGSVQLIELHPDGTRVPLTALPGACSGRYVPGERAVVVEHDDGGNERAQLSLLPLEPPPSVPVGLDGLRPLVRDPAHIHALLDVSAGRVVYKTNRRNGVDFDVLARELADGSETVLYEAGGWVGETAVDPRGGRLVIGRAGAQPMSGQLVLASPTTGGMPRELTGAHEHAIHEHTAWTPDGTGLIITTNRGRDFTAIAHYELATGAWRWLVTDDAHDLAAFPSPDGRLLLVVTNDDGAARLALHDTATGVPQCTVELPENAWTAGHPSPDPVWSPDSRHIAVSISAPGRPGDVLLVQAATGAVQALTDSGAQLADHPVASPEPHRIPTPDGESIPCFLYRPTAQTSLAGSAVLIIHGGPEGQSVRSFNPLIQALAAAGHTVLMPNVRGSVGYGRRYYSLDDVRRRLDSVADLATIHDHLPALGLNPARAALWGGSYGGYMVLAGVAFQPERWAAGVDIVGISSLVTFLRNTSPYRRAVREREYGSLEHDLDFLERASPLSRIDDIRAPLFVIHGANDPRVPLTEAQQLAAALEHNGVPVELHVYDDEGHGLAKRPNRLDAYPKAVTFLAQHLS